MKTKFKWLPERVRRFLLSDVVQQLDRSQLLLGQIAAREISESQEIDCLGDVEFRVYSQWGEDGILEWLIRNLPISSHCFVEFGVEDYTESNTRFLVQHRYWKGLVIDCDPENVRAIRDNSLSWRHDLTAVCSFVTRDNINRILEENEFTDTTGVLSIDIDGNDYWIWEAIEVIVPDIVVCEYNAVLGDIHPVTIPYQDNFQRTKAHHSNLYWGTSIMALCALALRKGYVLVGSNMAGNNAFFVRRELASYLNQRIKDMTARPSLIREARDPQGRLTDLGGVRRLDAIKHLSVVRVDTGETIKLETLTPVYSERWLTLMRNESVNVRKPS